jgi:hypothetical protein
MNSPWTGFRLAPLGELGRGFGYRVGEGLAVSLDRQRPVCVEVQLVGSKPAGRRAMQDRWIESIRLKIPRLAGVHIRKICFRRVSLLWAESFLNRLT